MLPFLGSVAWGPTRIVSSVVDAGSARVTAGTVMVARCASCAPAARDQIPNARSMATAVPAANLIAVPFDDGRKRDRAALPTLTSPTACMHMLIFHSHPRLSDGADQRNQPNDELCGSGGTATHEASATKPHNGLGHEREPPSAGSDGSHAVRTRERRLAFSVRETFARATFTLPEVLEGCHQGSAKSVFLKTTGTYLLRCTLPGSNKRHSNG
jgi:hypothetical protein